jgi:hypothetical protein
MPWSIGVLVVIVMMITEGKPGLNEVGIDIVPV